MSLRRYLGWEPRRHTYTRPDGHTTTVTEPEFDGWERALWRAYDEWEQGRCPDCGQSLAESLWDPAVPDAERPRWRATYRQCRACLEVENAQNRQAELDEQEQRRRGAQQPMPHRHRKWQVDRDDVRGR